MNLEFCLLVVDDHPDSVDQAIGELQDYLETKGFRLEKKVADDLSDAALRDLARRSGKDYNLVMVDYNLGKDDRNGAAAAARLRRELQYTDMVFYSSGSEVDLLSELAKQNVAGVFVANRGTLGDSLKGLAETVIGKAVDLNHMRGIAMAEVAEMDIQMEETLGRIFSMTDECVVTKAKRTMERLVSGISDQQKETVELVEKGDILAIIDDPRLFSSMHKYRAIMRVADCLKDKPADALAVLRNYQADIIDQRNTLAHAQEEKLPDGTTTLRAIKKGSPAVSIDEAWMTSFRGRLRTQRSALDAVCGALGEHVDKIFVEQK